MTTTRKRTASSTTASPRTSKRVKTVQPEPEEQDGLNSPDEEEPTTNGPSTSLTKLPSQVLTTHLPKQRSAILARLAGHITPSTSLAGLEDQLTTLRTTLRSTIERGESNSILLVGAKGSGKSALVGATLSAVGQPYHHVYISALHCTTDRSAMRELARQLIVLGALGLDTQEEDVGRRFGIGVDGEDEDEQEEEGDGEDEDEDEEKQDDNEQDEHDHTEDPHALDDMDEKAALGTAVLSSLSSATSSILSLLASAPSSAKPLLITLDHFDLLTNRPRQALLYCLLDAVQSGTYKPGLAIVGMTRRVDTTDLLEKRVKSRFSHRIVQCYPPATRDEWRALVEGVLKTEYEGNDDEFRTAWTESIDTLLVQPSFQHLLTSTTELSHDVQHLFDILYPAASLLSPSTPQLTYTQDPTEDTTIKQLYDLPTLSFLFLIASKHLTLRDRIVFNFEIAFDEIVRFSRRVRRERDAVDTSSPSRRGTAPRTAPPPPWEDRTRAMMAFERLLDLEILLPDAFLATLASVERGVGSGSTTTAAQAHAMRTSAAVSTAVRKEYLRVRSAVDPHVISEVAKERAKRGTLSLECAQWAARAVV